MIVEKIVSGGMRILFVAAFGLLAIAAFEVLANVFGYTITRGSYAGGRLLEFAAIFLIFVVTLLLRQIREQLVKRDPGKAN
jgi:hypothetical protein